MPYLSSIQLPNEVQRAVSISGGNANRKIVHTYSNADLIFGKGRGELHCYINDKIAYIAKGNFDYGSLDGEGELIEYLNTSHVSVSRGTFKNSQLIHRTFFETYDFSA